MREASPKHSTAVWALAQNAHLGGLGGGGLGGLGGGGLGGVGGGGLGGGGGDVGGGLQHIYSARNAFNSHDSQVTILRHKEQLPHAGSSLFSVRVSAGSGSYELSGAGAGVYLGGGGLGGEGGGGDGGGLHDISRPWSSHALQALSGDTSAGGLLLLL